MHEDDLDKGEATEQASPFNEVLARGTGDKVLLIEAMQTRPKSDLLEAPLSFNY